MRCLSIFLLLLGLHGSSGYSISLSRSDFLKRGLASVSLVLVPELAGAEPGKLEGVYSDPNHPKGYRSITTSASKLTIEGSDTSKTSKTWELTGSLGEGDAIVIDFSPKGGPKNLPGKFVGDGIVFPDGNKWPKVS
ncbi:hypothetical protein TrVE_jg1575 [Triparma verrucosa]|uniref:Uncharacterized protein n=1 Tax=Triparma verrucosa TaxID=1606542 RepID=A0A9W7FMC6_9STRA|nr:hypothetical protein TrVE_jg1575 [Triparma verrucosa]